MGPKLFAPPPPFFRLVYGGFEFIGKTEIALSFIMGF